MQVAYKTRRLAQIFSQELGAPGIEFQLLAKLPPGTGDFVIRSGMRVQESQRTYELAFEESSALCVGIDPERDDWSAAYTFAVTELGIEFHQHAGPRIITAITGSAGCTVSLSTCVSVNGTVEPGAFVERMIEVILPADTQFILPASFTAFQVPMESVAPYLEYRCIQTKHAD